MNDAQHEVEGVAQRLRKERPEASPLELDRIKTAAMSRAKVGTRGSRAGARRLAVVGLAVGLLTATTGGVIAGQGSGQSSGNAAIAQYGNNCDTNNNNGPIGSGNGNGNGNANASTAFASFIARPSGNEGGGNGGGNNSNNGNNNGNDNGNENGNGSGNGNNNYNCNENSFNETINNITNNYGGSTTVNNYTTVNAAPATGVLGAKSSKKATSGRRIRIHVRVPRGAKVRKVTVRINGKRLKTLVGRAAKANIELVKLPCSSGATTIEVSITLSNGQTVTARHRYHLCTA
jgi:hypothetical protein